MDIYVYMLRCRDGSYYVGLTRAGLDQRIGQHHEGTFDGYTARADQLSWSGTNILSASEMPSPANAGSKAGGARRKRH
jgi:predicted GIY-YIG superfamily endonuclease